MFWYDINFFFGSSMASDRSITPTHPKFDLTWPGSNSQPSDHDSTFHVTETPALTTWPSVTSAELDGISDYKPTYLHFTFMSYQSYFCTTALKSHSCIVRYFWCSTEITVSNKIWWYVMFIQCIGCNINSINIPVTFLGISTYGTCFAYHKEQMYINQAYIIPPKVFCTRTEKHYNMIATTG